MKNALLSLFLLLGILANAQSVMHRQCVFDFTNPLQLIPSVTPGTYAGAFVDVTDSVFVNYEDSLISISFTKNPKRIGPAIVTDYDMRDNQKLLQINVGSSIIITSRKAYLSSFRIDETSTCGDLLLVRPDFADTYDNFGHWTANEHLKVDTLEFKNAGHVSEFNKIIVEYDLRQDILEPLAIYPKPDTLIYKFDSMALEFADTLTLLQTQGATLRRLDGAATIALTASVEGRVLMLSAATSISDLGNYLVVLPKDMVKNKDGFTNASATYELEIVEPFNTFIMESVAPTEGVVSEIPNQFSVTFPDVVGGVTSNTVLVTNREGVVKRTATGRRVGEKTVVFTFDNDLPAITEKNHYTITIPEGTVYDVMYHADELDYGTEKYRATFNPQIDLHYNVGGIEFPSEAVLQEATELLEYVGVGYPAENSPARLALKGMVESGQGSDAILQELMDDYYSEKNIQLPEVNKWYTISSVGSDGSRLYLQNLDGRVVLTDNSLQATPFKSICNDTIFFQTPDTLYLHQLLSPIFDGLYEGTSSNNVTNELDSVVNAFKLARFDLPDIDSKLTFGLVSMNATMGKKNGEYIYSYTLINNMSATFSTQENETLNYFTENLTNAFRIEEVDAPAIPDPVVDYILSPASETQVETLSAIRIKFPSLTAIDTIATDKITLKNKATKVVCRPVDVVKVANLTNEYILHFADTLSSGSYELVIPEGLFIYELEDRTAKVQEITAEYTLSVIDFLYDFTTIYDIFYEEGLELYADGHLVMDYELNSMTLYSYQTDFAVDETKDVIIQTSLFYKEVARGHFVRLNNYVNRVGDNVYAIKLVLDEPIKAGSLLQDSYQYLIKAGTYGDANFGKYLADPSSVSKKDCHVNSRRTFTFDVYPSRIDGVDIDTDTCGLVYDLTGRRMSGDVKAGIYIVNGRKVVVR